MSLNNNYSQEDEMSLLIKELYNDIMLKSFELAKMRMQKLPVEVIDEFKIKLDEQQNDFESIIKTHTLFLKFQKASGHTDRSLLSDMAQKIREIKTNVSGINATIPQVNTTTT